MPDFVPGLQLSEHLYRAAIRPLIARRLPGLSHAAGLIGAGSDVLGYDTEMSMDHDWGPRLQLFVSAPDVLRVGSVMDEGLPKRVLGFPTFDEASGQHRVVTTTVEAFFTEYLGFDVGQPIEPADWLTFPEQKLRTITQGKIFHDGLGLEACRNRFAYYPDDVWLYQMASVWERIGQEEHLVGRAGYVGDEVGAAIIAARLARDIMRLAFLMEREYAPYPKWFGTAFARLRSGPGLGPLLADVLGARGWEERDARLAEAYGLLARMHNGLGITQRLPETAAPFFDRPFRAIHLHGGFADALVERIGDPAVRRIATGRRIGGIDFSSDSTDLATDPIWRGRLRKLYE